MQPRDVALEVVEAVAAGAPGGVEVDAVEALHDVHVIGNLKVRHDRLAEALVLDVLAVVPADRHGIVDDLRDDQHALADLRGARLLLLLQLGELVLHGLDLLLGGLRLLALALCHHAADGLADLVALRAQIVGALNRGAVFLVQLDDLIDQRELGVLKLLLDVLAHEVGIGAQKVDVQHDDFLLDVGPDAKKKKPAAPIWDEGLRVATQLAELPGRSKRDKERNPSAHRRNARKAERPPLPPDFHPHRLSVRMGTATFFLNRIYRIEDIIPHFARECKLNRAHRWFRLVQPAGAHDACQELSRAHCRATARQEICAQAAASRGRS